MNGIDCVQPPSLHMVITNISKRANVRALVQTAAAFQCASIMVVGQKSFQWDGSDLPQSVRQMVEAGVLIIQRFESWKSCTEHLKHHQIRLIGVEIHPRAQSLNEALQYHEGYQIAFLMGNEGEGIIPKHMESCDAFLRIPQYGGGTASLNVYVAAGIVLHRFYHFRRLRTAAIVDAC